MEDKFHFGIKALIRNEKKEILLLKVNTEILKNKSNPEYWDIPGGRLQIGDTIAQTLKREVEEETGIRSIVSTQHVATVLSNIRIPISKSEDVGLLLAIYVCEVSDISKIILSEEHTEYAWFQTSEAAKMLEFKYPKEFTEIVANLG